MDNFVSLLKFKPVTTTMHKIPLPILLLLLLCFTACRHTDRTGIHSPRYEADSLRTFGRAHRLYDEQREREAILHLDSIFLVPASLDPYAPPHPDSLGFAEARLLFNRALHNQTASFSLLMDYAYGLSYLDSLERRRIPLVERCCLRGLYICKAQMLMSLRRHAEALDYLTRAEALTEANDRLPENLREPVEYDSFWSAAAGMTYMGVDTVSTRAERSFLRVVDIARRTGYRGGLYAHAIARLADIYLHQSRYEESIALCRQALDAAPNDPADQSRLIAAENLAEAYRQLGLYDEALHYCSLITDAPTAVEAINNLRGRAYRNRAGILAEMNRTDEALADLQRSDSCFDRTGHSYNKLQTTLQRAHLLSRLPDSLDAGLRLFAGIKEEIQPHRQAFYHFYYGNALVQAENYTDAIPLLERAVTEAEAISIYSMAHESARLLAECYRHTGRLALLADLLPRYQTLADSTASNAKIRQLASANIRFETEKKEQENRALTAEVALKDSRLRTILLVAALCLLLAAGIIVWAVMRHRAVRIRQEAAATLLSEQQTQLHNLIRDRQQLTDRNLDLVRQLADIQSTHENTCDLDTVMESLQRSLFSKEDAERFRRNFSAVYPLALNRLRSRCPDLTFTDELFCMLAMLQLDNSEMARTLGISKPSVSKARYRLRMKLELPEGVDVDAEVRKVMEG